MFLQKSVCCLRPPSSKHYLYRTLGSNSGKSNGKHFDIIVAGGGMVGTTLACTLGKNAKLAKKRILLLEGSKESKFEVSEQYSNRVSSLNGATVKLLQNINVWDKICDIRAAPIENMQVWDALSDAVIRFDNEPANSPLAYVVENNVLLNAVQTETSHNTPNVDILFESKIKDCASLIDENLVKVELANGNTFTCELLLGCDGANSLVRKSFGFHYIAKNYNHMGIVATVKFAEECENSTAWQRQLPDSGFLALLPLKKGLSSLVWSTSAQNAIKLKNLTDQEFTDQIMEAMCKIHPQSTIVKNATNAFDNLIRFLNLPSMSIRQFPPKIAGCENRAIFPLGLGHSTNYVEQGVALVGDAAHRIHPLAGQGVNLGFGDVICLNKVLGTAAYSGAKLGSLAYLKLYETERQRKNIPMMMAVHGMFQLYSTQIDPIVFLRSLGIQAVHALPPVKKFLMSQAAGL